MSIEIIPYGGWKRNLLLKNDTVELLVTLDVGPRVLVFKRHDGANVLKNYKEQLGGTGESEWMIRGGHRIWLSPEDEAMTYTPDNDPVEHVVNADKSVTFVTPSSAPWRIRKELTIKLSESGSGVEIKHVAINEGGPPLEIATWGLTVMAPGGTEIIPQPPLGEHPRDLLSNRLMVIWPYTDLSDPRWKLGGKFFTLRQASDGAPTKIGLAHREKWIAYLLGEDLFVKSFNWEPGVPYPDSGCNFETFTNPDMLEVESLGQLHRLSSGQSAQHSESWRLFSTDGNAPLNDEDALAEWLQPFISTL